MATQYLECERYAALSEIQKERVTAFVSRRGADVNSKLELLSRFIEDKLRHRYAIPFPERHSTIEGWLVALVDPWALNQIGYDGRDDDPGPARIAKLEEAAKAEISAAGDPNSQQVINLPTRDGKDSSASTKGAPKAYSEPSPYTWIHVQARRVRGNV
jgi:hypothetical protein